MEGGAKNSQLMEVVLALLSIDVSRMVPASLRFARLPSC